MIRRKFFSPFNRYRFKLKNVRRRFNEWRESIKFNQVKKKNISYSSAKAINATDYFWPIYVHVYKLGIFQELQLVTTKKLISQTSRYRCSRMGWARTMMDVFHSLYPVLSSILYLIARFTLSLDSSCVKRERCFAAKKEWLSTDIHLNLW